MPPQIPQYVQTSTETELAAPTHHRRWLVIVVIAVLLLAIAGAGTYFYLRSKKSNNTTTSNSNSNSTTNNNSSSNSESSTTPVLPPGYQFIERDCFALGLLSQNLNLDANTTCALQASYGVNSASFFYVFPETNSYDNLDAFVAAKKQQYNSQVVSQDKFSLAGFDAVKVVENAGTAAAPQKQVRVYVLVSGKKYSYQNVRVTGFEINASYSDDTSIKAADTALGTWQWR